FDHEQMLNVTADVAVKLTGTDSCQIYLFDEDNEELILSATDSEARDITGTIHLKLGEGITGWVARERKPVAFAKEAYKDHRFKYFPDLKEGEFESMLSVPLMNQGVLLGVINVRTHRPHEYTRHQTRLLSGIANQVAGAINHLQRYRKMETRAVQYTALSEVSQAITANLYLEDLLHLFVSMTAQTMGYRICTVMLVDKSRGELVITATQASNKEYRKKPNLKIGESVSGSVAKTGQPMLLRDVQKAPEYRFPDIAQRAGVRSLASVPLIAQGEVIAVLNCYTAEVHEFTTDELVVLQALGNQAALAIQHAKLMVKSAVIQEMHHRIKNNLQQIVSLIRLEMRYSKYTTVEEALNDTLNRILAISSVHELLLRDNLDEVSIKKVAESLLHATQQSIIPSNISIQITIEGEDIVLPLAKATSMALVLNELLQNAIEHGFKTLTKGRVRIQLSADENRYRVAVLNDGDYLPEGFNIRKSDSLGLSIVDTLVRSDLHGTFVLENAKFDPGIIAIVTCPH
ncbi:MAG: GAF domain-containing protein, partial [Armatimonadetes bacterium]|nr:GAF domain-containing protein [Armatimonadota bacterium]